MRYLRMHLVMGSEPGIGFTQKMPCANDNLSKEQDWFEQAVRRELVEDCD